MVYGKRQMPDADQSRDERGIRGMALMDKFTQIWKRLFYHWRRDRFDSELEEEMRFHIEKKIEDNIAAGMSSSSARFAAQLEFGNQTLLREASREVWVFSLADTLWQDLRYGARNLLKHAILSTTIILTLTLGIGVSSGVFTLINAVVLRPRVDKDPDSFVRLYSTYTTDPTHPGLPGRTTL